MTGARGLKTIETLREIYDETHCGMALVGTDVWGKTLSGQSKNGQVKWHGMPASWEGVLSQTILRGINIYLPKNITYADQQRVWQAFGLPDPDPATLKIVQEMVKQYGLGRYTKRMRSGATTARKAGKEFTWGYFVAVHKQLENWPPPPDYARAFIHCPDPVCQRHAGHPHLHYLRHHAGRQQMRPHRGGLGG